MPTDISMILTGLRRGAFLVGNTSEIQVSAAVRERLNRLLLDNPELRGISSSAFIERACEVAETAIMEERTRLARLPSRPWLTIHKEHGDYELRHPNGSHFSYAQTESSGVAWAEKNGYTVVTHSKAVQLRDEKRTRAVVT